MAPGRMLRGWLMAQASTRAVPGFRVCDFKGLPRGTGGAAGLGVAAARCPRWIGRAGALGPRLPPRWVGSLVAPLCCRQRGSGWRRARLPPTWIRSLSRARWLLRSVLLPPTWVRSAAPRSAAPTWVGPWSQRGSGRRRQRGSGPGQRGSGPGPAARRVLVCYKAAQGEDPTVREARPGWTDRVTARFGRALRRRRRRRPRPPRRVAPGGSRLVPTLGSPGVVPTRTSAPR